MPSPNILRPACLALAALLAHAAHAGTLPAPATEVAVIGAERLTAAQLPPSTAIDLERHEQQYREKLRQMEFDHRREQQAILEAHVNDYLDSRLMQAEAVARHTTVAELIKEVHNPEVTDADIRAFYDQHQKQINQPFAQAMIPITQFLMQQAAERGKQAYLSGLRAKYGARVTLAPLRETVAASGPERGPPDAAVTIVEFADFQCPYCAKMAPVLRQALEHYPRDVRLVWRQLPIADLHPNATAAAQASVCAGRQGRFWEMHDALLADQASLAAPGPGASAALATSATRLGLDAGAFAACLKAPETAAAVKADADAGAALGVNGTPGLFVNGRFYNGAMTYEQLVAVIEDELQRQGRPVAARGASPGRGS